MLGLVFTKGDHDEAPIGAFRRRGGHRGGSFINPAVTERVLQAAGKGSPSQGPAIELTERETHVLRLVVASYSNREIATALEVSEGAIKNYMPSILAKIGVRDRTRAVLKGLEAGLF